MKHLTVIESCKEKSIKLGLKAGKLVISDKHKNLTPQLMQALKENKEAIVAWLSEDSEEQSKIIRDVNNDVDCPLSFAQQRLWFIDQLGSQSSQYNVYTSLNVKGRFDKRNMVKVLRTIIERHQVLRTTFVVKNNEPVQVVNDDFDFDITDIDLRDKTPALRQKLANNIINDSYNQTFDLQTDLMLRASHIQMTDDQCILLFLMHHIACDGWSMPILMREFTVLYQTYQQGGVNPLAELPIQYTDYASHQRQSTSQGLTKELNYWKNQLVDIPLIHALPLDKPRPKQNNYIGNSTDCLLDKALTDKLNALAQAHNATLFMVLQSAFALLLGRWSDQQDVVMGIPIAGRTEKVIEPLIGFFVNTLVFRSDLSPTLTFVELLEQARVTAVDAYANQAVPFDMLVDELAPTRTLSHSPLCQVTFTMQNNESTPSSEFSEFEISIIENDFEVTKFDIEMSANEIPSGVHLIWRYCAEIFELSTIERMAESYTLLLCAIAENPSQLISQLSLVPKDVELMQQRLGQGVEDTRSRDKTVVELIEMQVEQNPEATAIVFDQQRISYQLLNEKANRLADYLAEQDIGSGEFVGIYSERSVEMMIAILGVIKSGAAYIPIDTLNTSDRLSHIIEDAGIEVVLTSAQALKGLPVAGIDVLLIDDAISDESWLQEYESTNPHHSIALDDSVYVIYTSGSTGKPKGVDISHRGLVDYLAFARDNYYQSHLGGSIVATSHSFDISVPSLYLPLMVGATVDLLADQDSMSGLAERLSKVDGDNYLLRMTPMHVKGFLALMGNAVAPSSHQHVFVIGGVSFNGDVAHALQSQFPQSQIYNHYGPSEAVVGCCIFDYNAHGGDIDAQLPIGRPMANTQLYVLESSLQVVQQGMVGELFIGGPCVAKGYLNQPQLSAQKFIDSPFEPGQKLYRTGDLVRWLSPVNGSEANLAFIGRVDEQVKIRGFRIELGEIETQLAQQKPVKDVVVIARGEEDNKQLVAYVVADNANVTDTLRAHLKAQLPEYMMPSAFVILDELPLNANGKVNKRALPAPDHQAQQAFVAPSTPTEQQLASIWQDILKVENISVTANFFELGGHSLLATRVVSEIANQLEKKLSVSDLFEYSDIQSLAAHLELQVVTVHQNIPVASRDKPLRLSFAQQRLWFIDQLDGSSSQYNMPFHVVLDALDQEAFHATLNALVARHEILRTVYRDLDGEGIQVVQPPSAVLINYHDLSHFDIDEAQERAANMAHQDAVKPFNLSEDLMLRVSLLKLDESRHMVVFNMHHIASDGWSTNILQQEFTQLYQAFEARMNDPLTPLNLQYADYAQWQRQWLSGEVLEQQQQYWRKQLANIPQLHGLGLDKTRPAVQTFAGATFHSMINLGSFKKLQTLCQAHGVTLFMGLHAAFAVLLSRYSHESDIVIGTPVANREHSAIAPLIGFFVNTLVLRSDLSGRPGFVELLAQSKTTALGAYAHQQLPFESLVEILAPQRSTSHSPIFQIMLSLNNNYAKVTRNVANMRSQQQTVAKFDLTLNVNEGIDGLGLDWEYSTSLFNADTIATMADCFARLLDGMLANPQRSVDDIEMISTAEMTQLQQWNEPSASEQSDVVIYQLFERQVVQTPNEIALVFEQTQLCYLELDQQANQIAHYLISQGIKPGMLVGLCFERSITMMAAMLGIFKSGAGYLPLESTYPHERLQYMVSDSGVELILVSPELAQAGIFASDKTLILDGKVDHQPQHSPELIQSLDDTAYVIYTSGSTGKPKGVEISHQAIAIHAQAMVEVLLLTSTDKVLQFSSMAVDTSLEQSLAAWLGGAQVHVSPAQLWSDGEFFDYFQEHQITVADLPPAYVQMLLKSPLNQPEFWLDNGLRTVIMGGESLPIAVVRHWAENNYFDKVQLINAYGPTETTITASFHDVQHQDADKAAVPIGYPVAGRSLHVLSESLQLLPTGVIGELYIGGACLAKGYLNRPQLNEQTFIIDPHNDNRRLYKTGDLVRRLADGTLAFIGRADEQVKIRGFRIELGEIENQLSAHEAVDEVIVIAKGQSSDKRIVAYVVGDLAENATEVLVAHLSTQLPDYMIPSSFMVLDVMPLMDNGKVNRAALPEPQYLQQDYIAPKNDTERQLVAIWQELIGIEKIGVHDNFFEIGGDSILSIQVISRAKLLGIGITTKQLFENQTVFELAKKASADALLKICQQDVKGSMPLLPIQLKYLHEEVNDNANFIQSVLLNVPTAFDELMLKKIVTALYQRHDALRLRFQQVEDNWQATHVDFDQTLLNASCVVELLPTEKSEHDNFISQVCDRWLSSFDLHLGPVFRVVYFKSQSQNRDEERLFIVAHHIIVDGVSWRILLADVEQAYQQLSNQQEIALQAKTSSLQHWGKSLHDYAHEDELAQQQPYWLTQLEQQVEPLPVDFEQDDFGRLSTQRGVEFSLDEAQTNALLQRCNQAYRTKINELLLSAVYLGMRRWTKQQGLRITLEGHGREDIFAQTDTSQTLGWFTTMFPLTLFCQSEEIEQVIKAVKEQVRAVPDNGIGYGVLRYITQDPQLLEASKDDKATFTFNYLGQFDQTINQDNAFSVSTQSSGGGSIGQTMRSHQLGVVGMVTGGVLRFNLDHSTTQYSEATMTQLAGYITTALVEVINHCQKEDVGSFTPADFPLAHMSQQTLDDWQRDYPQMVKLYPGTPMQAGLIFHSMMESTAYMIQNVSVYKGALNTQYFRRAWQNVIDRLDIYRTVFLGEGDNLHQLVLSTAQLPWHEEDWRALSPSEQQSRFERYRLEDHQQGFNFEQAPLMRIAVFRTAEDECKVLWTNHHVLSDGWSTPYIYKELLSSYQALLAGTEQQLKPLPPYENYISWLKNQGVEAAEQYWREQLQHFEAPTPLGIDKLDGQQNGGQLSQTLHYDLSQTKALQSFVQSQRNTLFTLIQLTWAYLLHKYSGETNVMFGVTISGRPAEVDGIEEMVGLFINTIPVTRTFDDSQTVLEMMQNLHKDAQHAAEYGFLSLVDIQRQSNIRSGINMFDSCLAYDNYPTKTKEQGPGNKKPLDVEMQSSVTNEESHYKLILNASMRETLSIKFTYRGEDFCDSTISRLMGHFNMILMQYPKMLDQPMTSLELLSAKEIHEITRWSETTTRFEQQLSMVQIFERHVATNPQAVAIVHHDESITYEELNQQANQLAHYLLAQEIKPNQLVGVCLERSIEMLIAIVGILKSGAAYMPIDPTAPEDRIEYMLDDAQVELVVTQSDLLSVLSFSDLTLVPIDGQFRTMMLGEYATDNVDAQVAQYGQQQLAFLIYTSGSTGRPKGVLVEQRGIINLTNWQYNYYRCDATTVVSQFASFVFDASVGESFMALLNGLKLVILSQTEDPKNIITNIIKHQVNVIVLVPSVLKLLDFNQITASQQLTLVSVGEKLSADLAAKLKDNCRLINGYGPTEFSVYSHVCEVEDDLTKMPIGKAIDNAKTLLLDSRLNMVPVGVVGEIYLSGAGIARGYHNRPDLTEQSFIENPHILRYLFSEMGDISATDVDDNDEYDITASEKIKQLLELSYGDKKAFVDKSMHSMSDELKEQFTHLSKDYFDDTSTFDTRFRYFLEGLYGTYYSSGLNESLLFKILQLQSLTGLQGVDFGAGSGEVVKLLAKMGANMTALDVNPLFIEKLNVEGIDARMAFVDAQLEPFLQQSQLTEDSMDFVLSTLLLDRLADPLSFLNNFFHVLKPHGSFALQTLLPIIGEDDGQLGGKLVYTQPDKQLVPGHSVDEDKLELVKCLTKLGGYNIKVYSFDYSVHCKDGLMTYKAWSFCGNWQPAMSEQVSYDKLYKTGDLGRYLPNGDIEFLGRVDHQVKIRGMRIETTEIESLLDNQPSVKESLVTATGEPKRLVAYVVPQQDVDSDMLFSKQLREALKNKLPINVVPSIFVVLRAFALTPNGKIDVNALPEPDYQMQLDYVPPTTQTQKQLVEIWQDVLQLDEIGIQTSFFELGGHSLLATRVITQIAAKFNKTVAIKAIFQHTSVFELAAHVDQLQVQSYKPITVVSCNKTLPLSFAQQRLWFVDKLEGGSRQYNLPGAIKFSGDLNVEALAQAIDTLVARHEVLRTVFRDVEGNSAQVVKDMQPVPLNRMDLRGDVEQDKKVSAQLELEISTPFDLANDVLLRCTLIQLADDQFVLLYCTHHIASDGWSMGILIKDFVALYEAYKNGQSNPLPPLEIQYGDYAYWQQEQVQGEGLQKELDYWQQRLSGMPQLHSLPLDKPRPAQQSYVAGTLRHKIDSTVSEQLNQLALEHDASLFMVLQSAFALLLSRWSHVDDIVMATPVAGRIQQSLEPMIGLFLNNLILRSEFSEQQSYLDVLLASRTHILDAFDNQQIPFEMLVDELKPDRDLSFSPLCQIKFVLQNHEIGEFKLDGLKVSGIDNESEVVHFDLDLTATEFSDGLYLSWSYKKELFDGHSIQSMAACFEQLLQAIVDDPSQNVATMPLMDVTSQRAQEQLGVGSNNDHLRGQPLISLIEAQVAQTPQANAVLMGEKQLSYALLNQKANRLADYLAEQDIGQGDQVGIYAERSLELMISILGIMKSGAAYIPIDTQNTGERLSHIISDAQIELILTHADALKDLPVEGIDMLMMDDAITDDLWLNEYNDQNPQHSIELDDSAYVIYTSGSTGKPKGVDISHGGLIDYCAFALEHYYSADLKGSLVVTSHSFDITVPSLYLPLMAGGCVDLLDDVDNVSGLSQRLRAAGDDNYLLRMTPMHVKGALELLGENAEPSANAHVFVIGGESFSADIATALQTQFPHSQIYNHYGPSEAVVGCSIFDFTGDGQQLAGQLPIGRPMENTQLYVLNDHQQAVAQGTVGELYVGGLCVAKGYLNQPQLSAEKFISSDFIQGQRLYRTGDLVRWLADGNLEFIGRIDAQVKIRGFRIELGEIESQLAQHDNVDEAVVIALGEGEQKTLVAYITSHSGADGLVDSLRAQLKQALPNYMNPSAYVMLDAMPLSANGKLDKRALPAPDHQAQLAYTAPKTDMERQIAAIWQQILNLETVSTTASFFELGGHSLLATKFIMRLKSQYAIDLPLRQLFECPTIKALCDYYQDHQTTKALDDVADEDITDEGWL